MPVELSEKEIRTLTMEQLGTSKDSQYRAAETTLLKALRSLERGQAYQPGSANLQSASA